MIKSVVFGVVVPTQAIENYECIIHYHMQSKDVVNQILASYKSGGNNGIIRDYSTYVMTIFAIKTLEQNFLCCVTFSSVHGQH